MHVDQIEDFKSTIMLLVFGLSMPAALTLQTGEVFAQLSAIGLQNQTVSYFANSSGYLVSPLTDDSSNTTGQLLPAVVMIHEWWGLNEHIEDMVNKLAEQGYVVLAADLFNSQVAT
jgi:Dienelactone hydrolase family